MAYPVAQPVGASACLGALLVWTVPDCAATATDAVVDHCSGVAMDFVAAFALHTVAFPCEVMRTGLVVGAVVEAVAVPISAAPAIDSHMVVSVMPLMIVPQR